MTIQKNYRPDEDGKVSVSKNAHYAVYVVEREEAEYPNERIKRYEVVNLSTLAVEGRLGNLHMAVLVMDEFDTRMENLITNGPGGSTESSASVPQNVIPSTIEPGGEGGTTH